MRESSAFRRCIILLLQAIIIVAQTYTFWHFWDTYYSEGLTRMFFFKGHIVIVFLYALLFGVFIKIKVTNVPVCHFLRNFFIFLRFYHSDLLMW